MVAIDVKDMHRELRLADGRRLAYEETGDRAGAPVVFCHGWMSSRLVRHPDPAATAAAGVRLVTFDRPGVGRSDAASGMTFASTADDMAALADHLGLGSFAVFGHSGGGPYALACARALPDRVARVAVASGFAPFDRPDAYAGMTPRMRGFVRLLHRAPWLAGPFLRGVPGRFRRDPERAFARQFGPLCESDRAALADPAAHDVVLAAAVEALAGGSAGVAREAQLLFARPWGFSPAEVRCHVDLWYGDADTIVPVEMGRHLAAEIPDSDLVLLPGQGHMLFVTHWAEILSRLGRR
jgi:pimeloyl-ACP methyl ester carboxylesterase